MILIGGFAISVPIDMGQNESDPKLPTYSAADPAMFEISARRGTLTLSGNTVSNQHEEQLRLAVADHYPGMTVRTDFRPLGVAPSWWGQVTTELVAALPAIQSPTAQLRADILRINGVVANKAVAELQLQTLRKVLPVSATFDVRLTSVAANTTARTTCARHFTNLEPGPINFEESGTEFRASAYPALDRIVALADACRDSTVSITGHTDSSGNEARNQQLSLQRARAVASYLGEMGIEPARMVVAGAGSSLPISTNATRFGRGLNRRIDIHMTPARPD